MNKRRKKKLNEETDEDLARIRPCDAHFDMKNNKKKNNIAGPITSMTAITKISRRVRRSFLSLHKQKVNKIKFGRERRKREYL